jgi:hypothetical protein
MIGPYVRATTVVLLALVLVGCCCSSTASAERTATAAVEPSDRIAALHAAAQR